MLEIVNPSIDNLIDKLNYFDNEEKKCVNELIAKKRDEFLLNSKSPFEMDYALKRMDPWMHDLMFLMNEVNSSDVWENYIVRLPNWNKGIYNNANQVVYGQMMHHTVKTASSALKNGKLDFDGLISYLAQRRKIIALFQDTLMSGSVGDKRESNMETDCINHYAEILNRFPKEQAGNGTIVLNQKTMTIEEQVYILEEHYTVVAKIGEGQLKLSSINFDKKKLIHTDAKTAEVIMAYVKNVLFQRIMEETDEETIMRDLGRMFWWLCQAKPWKLGDPSIAETLFKTILELKGCEIFKWREKCIPWVEAMVFADPEQFSTHFIKMFDRKSL